MKRKSFAVLILALTLTIALTICLGACDLLGKKMDRYTSVVPTDTDYHIYMTYSSDSGSGARTQTWTVVRKSAYICEQQRIVIYVDYSYSNERNHDYDYTRKLLYVNGKVLGAEDGRWQPYTGSFGDKWSDIYGSYSAPGSFVYEITQSINGRDFPVKYKKETADYIEYDFGRDNEVFRISTDIYHLLKYYTFDYEDTHIRQEATILLGTPADSIPFTDTITAEMLEG